MWDDFGHVYIVLLTVNDDLELTIDDIADIIQTLQPKYELLSKRMVNTARGRELRSVSYRE